MNVSELGGCNHSFKHHWSISHVMFLGGQVKRVPGLLLADECLQLSYNPPAWVLVSKFWFSPWVFCCWTEFMFLMCCSINCFIQDLQKKWQRKGYLTQRLSVIKEELSFMEKLSSSSPPKQFCICEFVLSCSIQASACAAGYSTDLTSYADWQVFRVVRKYMLGFSSTATATLDTMSQLSLEICFHLS